MFINTKAETKIAVSIAHKHGYTFLDIDSFYKKYVVNAFSPWASHQDARDAQAEINETIGEDRLSKRRPSKEELGRETRQGRELVAHNISARTGELFNNIIKRLG